MPRWCFVSGVSRKDVFLPSLPDSSTCFASTAATVPIALCSWASWAPASPAAADTAPALMTLGAMLELESTGASRTVAAEDFWVADGISNRRLQPGEILVAIRIPPTPPGHRGAYGKLRERGSIDFPLLGVAVRIDLDAAGLVERAELVLTALAAKPRRVAEAASLLGGTRPGSPEFEQAVLELADLAQRRCRTLPNLQGDTVWRQAMIPVYVRRTLQAAMKGDGPVHHL